MGGLVDRITAFLFHTGGDDDPLPLKANANKSFQGSIVLGMGFTFDDTDKTGVANPISVMHELIRKDPRNAERIFPYIGGEEVNDSPTHAHHRFVINFGQMPLRREPLEATWASADDRTREKWLRTGVVPLDHLDPVAADWPDLLAIVERKVKPQRDKDNRASYRNYWWQFAEKRVELVRSDSWSRAGAGDQLQCNAPHVVRRCSGGRGVREHARCLSRSVQKPTSRVLQCRIHEVMGSAASVIDEGRSSLHA